MKLRQMYCTLGLLVWFTTSIYAQGSAAAEVAAKPTGKIRISTEEELKREFEKVPCKNDERLAAVQALFVQSGANPSEIRVEKLKNVENVVLTLPGETTDKVIVGAHYDVAGSGSCGAIDNWTGIVAIAHLYRSFKEAPRKKTLVFVAFGKEELGLIGSTAMAEAIKKQNETAQYCAMYNIDSLGLAMPQIDDHLSSKSLVELGESLAKKMEIPFAHGSVAGESDSAPFLKIGIPALTLMAVNADWMKILHSRNDQAKAINETSVYLGYRLALSMLTQIDAADCQAFREVKKK